MRMNVTFTPANRSAWRAVRRIGSVLAIYLCAATVALAVAVLGRAG